MARKTLYIQPAKAAITAAKKGLEARKKAPKSKKGGLDTQQAKAEGVGSGVARARDIIAGKKVNAYQVKAFFDRHRQNYINAKMKGLKPEESRAIQAWLIWGGEPLRKQAEREVAKHEKTMAKNPDNKTYTVKIFRGKHAGKTRTYKTLKAAHRACDRLDLEYGAICCRVVRAKEDSSEENPKLTRKEMQELQSRAAQERFAEAMGYENIYEWEEEKKSEQKKKKRTSNPKKTPTVHATFNKWVDAQKLAKQYPDTFEAPNIGDLKKNIKIGDFVKWNIDKERIWMIVLDVNRDTIIGIIDNKPIDTKYKLGDIAKIKFRHVYSFEPGNKSSQKKADDFLQQLEDKKQKKAKKKAPTAKALIARCQRLWEAYCKRPGITKLRTVAKHCETMKSSKAKSVKTECARCMRSVQAEAKVKGWDL